MCIYVPTYIQIYVCIDICKYTYIHGSHRYIAIYILPAHAPAPPSHALSRLPTPHIPACPPQSRLPSPPAPIHTYMTFRYVYMFKHIHMYVVYVEYILGMHTSTHLQICTHTYTLIHICMYTHPLAVDNALPQALEGVAGSLCVRVEGL